jgi:hypothetical protein
MGVWHLIDNLSRPLFISQGDRDPYILQCVRYLAEQIVNCLETAGKQLVYTVFDRASVAHVEDEDLVPYLADALDATLPLLQACRVPGQVQINQRP